MDRLKISDKAAVKIGFFKSNQKTKFFEFCQKNGCKDKGKQKSLWDEYKKMLKKAT